MKIDYFSLYLYTFKRQILAVTLFRTGARVGVTLRRDMFLLRIKTARVKLKNYAVKSVLENDINFSLHGILL